VVVDNARIARADGKTAEKTVAALPCELTSFRGACPYEAQKAAGKARATGPFDKPLLPKMVALMPSGTKN